MNKKEKELGTFKEFIEEVRNLCESSAGEKGYNNTGIEGRNDLYQFIQTLNGGDEHAIGEMIYKVVRYKNKKEKRDLAKIAAWAYLVWKFGK